MNDRLAVIIGTGETAKAQTGLMYATNALKHGWMSDVKLFFFGPAEDLLLEDPDLQEMLLEFQRQDQTAVACRFLSDREGTSEGLAELGVQVSYVGSMISDLIKDGYVPMAW
jgi:hypothetical protein